MKWVTTSWTDGTRVKGKYWLKEFKGRMIGLNMNEQLTVMN